MSKAGDGKFIVLYAANNLGKSVQMDLLEKLWIELEKPYVRLKYPIYDLEPTGPLINSVLRQGAPMSDWELQFNYAQNRHDFQPTLEWYLRSGADVLAEDYVGTGLAWGLTRGVERFDLDVFNFGLRKPDLSILLDGERFSGAIEKGHRYEEGGQWAENRRLHRELAAEFGWEVVNANASPEAVHREVVQRIFR
jgi:thymidylate kinase